MVVLARRRPATASTLSTGDLSGRGNPPQPSRPTCLAGSSPPRPPPRRRRATRCSRPVPRRSASAVPCRCVRALAAAAPQVASHRMPEPARCLPFRMRAAVAATHCARERHGTRWCPGVLCAEAAAACGGAMLCVARCLLVVERDGREVAWQDARHSSAMVVVGAALRWARQLRLVGRDGGALQGAQPCTRRGRTRARVTGGSQRDGSRRQRRRLSRLDGAGTTRCRHRCLPPPTPCARWGATSCARRARECDPAVVRSCPPKAPAPHESAAAAPEVTLGRDPRIAARQGPLAPRHALLAHTARALGPECAADARQRREQRGSGESRAPSPCSCDPETLRRRR